MIKKRRSKVKAAALSYAILFLLLVGLITSSVLFIASTSKRIEHLYNLKEHLIFDNYLALRSFSNIKNKDSLVIIHPSGDTSIIKKKKWGAFEIASAYTFSKKNSVKKNALIGEKKTKNKTCLYLCDNGYSLKIGGESLLDGNVFIPKKGIERAHLSNKPYTKSKLVFGKKNESETFLPPLNEAFNNLDFETYANNTVLIQDIPIDSTFEFKNSTTLFSKIEPFQINQKLKGNIILHSFDSITIKQNASLDNVIVIAPIVHIEKGFKGNLQVIAHQKIHIEENVKLNYPSILVLNKKNNSTSSNNIYIDENVQIRGGILITSQIYTFKKPPRLIIKPNSMLAGLIYNVGETELNGTILGTLYTKNITYHSKGNQYANHLIDSRISSSLLPKDFIYPNWIKNESNSKLKYEIITCF